MKFSFDDIAFGSIAIGGRWIELRTKTVRSDPSARPPRPELGRFLGRPPCARV